MVRSMERSNKIEEQTIMEIEKILDGLPFHKHGNLTLYKGLVLEERLKGLDSFFESEDVIISPFYVWPDLKVCEMYQEALEICATEHTTFEEYVKRVFRSDEPTQSCVERLKNFYIGAPKGKDILPELKRYVEFILYGEYMRQEHDEYFRSILPWKLGYLPENIYFEVY